MKRALLLLLLAGGCASPQPEAPAPEPLAVAGAVTGVDVAVESPSSRTMAMVTSPEISDANASLSFIAPSRVSRSASSASSALASDDSSNRAVA